MMTASLQVSKFHFVEAPEVQLPLVRFPLPKPPLSEEHYSDYRYGHHPDLASDCVSTAASAKTVGRLNAVDGRLLI